jgi:hypothetical protein
MILVLIFRRSSASNFKFFDTTQAVRFGGIHKYTARACVISTNEAEACIFRKVYNPTKSVHKKSKKITDITFTLLYLHIKF